MSPFLLAAFALAVSGALSYGLYRLLNPPKFDTGRAARGKRFGATTGSLIALATLTRALSNWDNVDLWLAVPLLTGIGWPLAFLIGWALTPRTDDGANDQRSSRSHLVPLEPLPQSAPSEAKHATTQQGLRASQNEDSIYERIAAELESGQLQSGLWTRLYAENGGDEIRTKVAYIRERAARIAAAEVQEEAQPIHAPTTAKAAPTTQAGPTFDDAPDPALLEAVWKGNWNTASVLLAQGKRITGVDSNGRTLLELATIRKDRPMLELLRKYIPSSQSPPSDASHVNR